MGLIPSRPARLSACLWKPAPSNGDIDGIIAMIHEIGKVRLWAVSLVREQPPRPAALALSARPSSRGRPCPPRSPCGQGAGCDVCHDDHGSGPHGGLCRGDQHLGMRRQDRSSFRRGAGRKYPGTCRSLRPLSMPRAIASLRHLPCSISLKPCRLLSIRSMPCMI